MAREKTEGKVLVAIEPRFARTMPWVLLLLALALALYAADAWQNVEVTQQVSTQKAGTQGTDVTKTESAPSDTVIGVLFGLAAITALAGAFYGRISKITLPGGAGLELGAAAFDLESIAKAVADGLKEELKDKAEPISVEEVADVAALATARAHQKALLVRLGLATSLPITRELREARPAQQGMPLPDDLVRRLAENAVRETLEEGNS